MCALKASAGLTMCALKANVHLTRVAAPHAILRIVPDVLIESPLLLGAHRARFSDGRLRDGGRANTVMTVFQTFVRVRVRV